MLERGRPVGERVSAAAIRAPESLQTGSGELVEVLEWRASLRRHVCSTVLPLLWKVCFIQKQAVELLSRPSKARWSSSVASAGSLMIGADRLKTLPPRSSTKWLCVATKAKAMESGVRSFVV